MAESAIVSAMLISASASRIEIGTASTHSFRTARAVESCLYWSCIGSCLSSMPLKHIRTEGGLKNFASVQIAEKCREPARGAASEGLPGPG